MSTKPIPETFLFQLREDEGYETLAFVAVHHVPSFGDNEEEHTRAAYGMRPTADVEAQWKGRKAIEMSKHERLMKADWRLIAIGIGMSMRICTLEQWPDAMATVIEIR